MSSKLSKTDQWQLSSQVYIEGINEHSFEDIALALFRHQYAGNELYRAYCQALKTEPDEVSTITEIPFLPISFFKTHAVATGHTPLEAVLIFESSGTTADTPSRHYVFDKALYETALLEGFREAFGPSEDYVFLALLPSYLERGNSSLVHMARTLMAHSNDPDNGFYLDEWPALAEKLLKLNASGKKTILLGVTFALLDFAAAYPLDISSVTVMETGGMKGRREEWTRGQVHDFLKERWNLSAVATEYGMTELLSQAYAQQDGLLSPTRSMRVLIRELNDPLTVMEQGSGALNIIDLANVHTCAFIATEDMGIVYDRYSFEVQGRMDHAALRGCSLMTA